MRFRLKGPWKKRPTVVRYRWAISGRNARLGSVEGLITTDDDDDYGGDGGGGGSGGKEGGYEPACYKKQQSRRGTNLIVRSSSLSRLRAQQTRRKT
ncbi:hypothetical protein M0804_008919 [Polistes exclamans]|nr:hypothetical protein M0804_008919 [Polistes exclamans]